jgi:alpha-tubulin suppressor-like RCC1 family protein
MKRLTGPARGPIYDSLLTHGIWRDLHGGRLMHGRAFGTAGAILLLLLGCHQDPTSPADPAQAADISASTALVFRQVSAGDEHSCGVSADDRAYCWGRNTFGELGDATTSGTDEARPTPVAVAGGLRFRQVSAGAAYTCGITTDSRAYCWGANFTGNLGDGTTAHHPSPVQVAGGRRFRQVSAGSNHTCAVNPYDVVFCWGSGWYGQLGNGSTTDRLTPERVTAGGLHFHDVSAGLGHTCAVGTDALVYCWGLNLAGQLGDGTTTNRSTPVAVRGGRSFRQAAAGFEHTCGVTTQNAAYCWGFDRYGQLGDGASGYARRRLRPVAVLGGLLFDAVTTGFQHSCGVTTGGTVYCWGGNSSGQLGDGTTNDRLLPTPAAGGLKFNGVAAGDAYTCGVAASGSAYCWGLNRLGQLGDGTTTNRLVPTKVAEGM